MPIVTNFWDAATVPTGFREATHRLRELIRVSQEPPDGCRRLCSFHKMSYGGAGQNVRRLAWYLMEATLRDCALVGIFPAQQNSTMATSPMLRERCHASQRRSLQCYFKPLSVCTQSSNPTVQMQMIGSRSAAGNFHNSLRRIANITGLQSELIIMGTLIAWVTRPQPELHEAIMRYGKAAGFDKPGISGRRVAMHVRRGDKHSLYAKHMRDHHWRVSTRSYASWARRIAANIGAEQTLFMSDDREAMHTLSADGNDSFFTLAPAPAECIPSMRWGLLGGKYKHAAKELGKLKSAKIAQVEAAMNEDMAPVCGPRYLVDDGIQFFAGMMLLAQCAAFVGTQLSNVDGIVVELASMLRHPPVYFDLLNDVHRAPLSDEMVWYGGIHTSTRPIEAESLMGGPGNPLRQFSVASEYQPVPQGTASSTSLVSGHSQLVHG